jgi:hypothetical protein
LQSAKSFSGLCDGGALPVANRRRSRRANPVKLRPDVFSA